MDRPLIATEDYIIEYVLSNCSECSESEVHRMVVKYFDELFKLINRTTPHVEIVLPKVGTLTYYVNGSGKGNYHKAKESKVEYEKKFSKKNLNLKRLSVGKIPNRYYKRLRQGKTWSEVEKIQNRQFDKFKKKRENGD